MIGPSAECSSVSVVHVNIPNDCSRSLLLLSRSIGTDAAISSCDISSDTLLPSPAAKSTKGYALLALPAQLRSDIPMQLSS